VTLIEMLVTVAVLVILMTILVQIFQAATGSVSTAQAYQQLDEQLRRLDGTIRADLEGVTARFTPPLDPAQNLGYFEYGENEFADNQGEDSDDYIRFTAKAPPERPFTGRMWVGNSAADPNFYNGGAQPVTITSEYAEIIYFLRNGNLYRRVLLVNPELQSQIIPALGNTGYLWIPNNPAPTLATPFTFPGGATVSWQGVNDLSARPAPTGPDANVINNLPAAQRAGAQAQQTIVLNTLGDLTNRENRFAYPRFANDFWNFSAADAGHDGYADDLNGDNVPDLYPSLYPHVFNIGLIVTDHPAFQTFGGNNNPYHNATIAVATQLMAFPFVFPGAYSLPQSLPNNAFGYGLGWIHSPEPTAVDATGNLHQFDGNNPLGYLQSINHNPLDLGDNLPLPVQIQNNTGTTNWQTWWGFPTWRETLSPLWQDPTFQVNVNQRQPNGLTPRPANVVPVKDDSDLLPAMTAVWRITPQLFTDGSGDKNIFFPPATTTLPGLWAQSWEDDLIMTGVRSFDVKAYDNALASYADLGWGDDPRITASLPQPYLGTGLQTPYLLGNYDVSTGNYNTPALALINAPSLSAYTDVVSQTFAHEGRMPPIVHDYRVDAQYGIATSYLPINSPYLVANGGTYNNGNLGDNNSAIVRLRRVWDSWSTEYSRAPGTGVKNATGFLAGPPFTPPIYPSYPPPYPAPLRGIQIQIRVVDPTNQRVKSLTIRQDFTDKL
jgi:type II secretory pathway component PulJ